MIAKPGSCRLGFSQIQGMVESRARREVSDIPGATQVTFRTTLVQMVSSRVLSVLDSVLPLDTAAP